MKLHIINITKPWKEQGGQKQSLYLHKIHCHPLLPLSGPASVSHEAALSLLWEEEKFEAVRKFISPILFFVYFLFPCLTSRFLAEIQAQRPRVSTDPDGDREWDWGLFWLVSESRTKGERWKKFHQKQWGIYRVTEFKIQVCHPKVQQSLLLQSSADILGNFLWEKKR